MADGLTLVDVVARVDVVERAEHADRRGDDHALGDEEPFAVVQAGLPWVRRPPGVVADVVGGGDVADGDVGDGALGERRRASSRARPRGTTSAPRPTSVSIDARQRTGTVDVLGRAGRASRRRRRRPRASWFETTGARGCGERRASASFGASPAVASAISGVWNAPPTLSGVARRTPSSLARADRGVEPVGGAGDHDLAGRVVVRDPARVGRGGARVLGLLDRRAEQRGHPAGVRVGRGLGELGAPGGEAHAVFEGERARRR